MFSILRFFFKSDAFEEMQTYILRGFVMSGSRIPAVPNSDAYP
jgi:hypothetical protein